MKYQDIRTEKKKGCGRKGISLLMAGTMAVSMLPAVPANAAELAEPTSAAVELAGREKAESGSLESLLAEENETSDPAVCGTGDYDSRRDDNFFRRGFF